MDSDRLWILGDMATSEGYDWSPAQRYRVINAVPATVTVRPRDWRPALFVPAAGIEVVDYLSIEKSHEDSGRTNHLVGGTFPMTESLECVLDTGHRFSIKPGLRCVSDRRSRSTRSLRSIKLSDLSSFPIYQAIRSIRQVDHGSRILLCL